VPLKRRFNVYKNRKYFVDAVSLLQVERGNPENHQKTGLLQKKFLLILTLLVQKLLLDYLYLMPLRTWK
jgi:hypothetical protein